MKGRLVPSVHALLMLVLRHALRALELVPVRLEDLARMALRLLARPRV